MLRIPGTRSDDVCFIVALDVKMLSWFDFLPSTNHTHRDYWYKGENLKHGCRYTAAAVLLLYTWYWFYGCEAVGPLLTNTTHSCP